MNWKTSTAAAIVTHAAPAVSADNSDLSLWHQLKVAIVDGKVAAGSLSFAKSVSDGFVKYGSFTPKQADAVRNLLARSNGQAEPNPVAGPDKALGESLRACLANVNPNDLGFATSLLSGFDKYGSFTDRQRPHVERIVKNTAARMSFHAQAPSAPEKPATTTCPNICAKVSLNGFSRFTVGQLALSLKNDGSLIWVKWDGRLVGLIDCASTEYRRSMRYVTSPVAHLAARNTLDAIEKDPLAAARENGIKTGRCSCCGRPLTDPVSIGYGIGPICRERGFGINL
jgi:hypothetical protein